MGSGETATCQFPGEVAASHLASRVPGCGVAKAQRAKIMKPAEWSICWESSSISESIYSLLGRTIFSGATRAST
jgi:hypothetical protein